MPSARIALLVLAATPIAAGLSSAQERLSLTTSFFARAMQPGEVVRLDVTCACGDDRPTATAFGHDVALSPVAGSGQWRGLIGIGLDTEPGAYPVTVSLDGSDPTPIASERLLDVVAKEFPTRRLRVDSRFVEPPARVRDRIEREARMMESLFATTTLEGWEGPFRLPVTQPAVSNFGARSVFNGLPRSPHGGVDFGSPRGTPIASPGSGRVALAESLYFTGNTVIVDHGLGLYSVFAHLSKFSVEKGDTVTRGAIVGLVGATGRVTGPHLHWTVRLQGTRVDPLSLIAALEDTKITKEHEDHEDH